jgi:hypothetical protein
METSSQLVHLKCSDFAIDLDGHIHSTNPIAVLSLSFLGAMMEQLLLVLEVTAKYSLVT